jgi:ribosome-binding protein aMBF1 (putative translation factor)
MSRITVAELIRELERDLGLPPQELAQALRVNPRTVDRWLGGDIPQRNEGRQRLDDLA